MPWIELKEGTSYTAQDIEGRDIVVVSGSHIIPNCEKTEGIFLQAEGVSLSLPRCEKTELSLIHI